METNENFLVNISVLYRNIMKYFDHVLSTYEIGSGQIIFLIYINENEGCTMQDVTLVSEVDKGTTTKSINRLIDQGYVQVKQDTHDKRIKRLYTTNEAIRVMNEIYKYRNVCRNSLAKDVDFDTFSKILSGVTVNSRQNLESTEPYASLKIGGLLKTTLLDYPGKVAATIFTSGCTFKCPFCHNKDLVYIPEDYKALDVEDVLAFLEKRKNILDGVCISGGEPLMQKELLPFLQAVKALGYQVKLDVTGHFVERLKQLVDLHLVDYIAMDVKNTKEKYAMTVGSDKESFSVVDIENCMQYVKNCGVSYEFRTTVVKELHTKEDMLSIAKWIGKCDAWYLQQFRDSENCIKRGFHAYNVEQMQEILESVKMVIPCVKLRGVKER